MEFTAVLPGAVPDPENPQERHRTPTKASESTCASVADLDLESNDQAQDLSRARATVESQSSQQQACQTFETLDADLEAFEDNDIATAAAAFGYRPISMMIPRLEWQIWYWINAVVCLAHSGMWLARGTADGLEYGFLFHGLAAGIMGVAFVLLCIAGLRNQVRLAKQLFVGSIVSAGIIELTVGVTVILGVSVGGKSWPLVHVAFTGNGPSYFFWAYIWWFREAWYIPAKALMAPFSLIVGVANIVMGKTLDPSKHIFNLTTVGWISVAWAPSFVGLVATYYYLRQQARRLADEAVAEDCALYLRRWSEILQVPTEYDAITGLCEYVSSLQVIDRDSKQTERSLSALYKNAEQINESFGRAVDSWAERTGGVQKACGLKRVKRALQKVRRCYGDDSTRLQDVTRSSIVFERTEQLMACLQIIAAESEIARIKNRLDPEFDAARRTAGYRDVSMNLAWPVPNGQKHMVELQLHLRSIFELKSAGGHKRYIEWRNLRGN